MMGKSRIEDRETRKRNSPLNPRYSPLKTEEQMMPDKEKGQDNPIKLLLVDDEACYVSVLAKRMAKRNIVAVTATNGNEAIQTLRGITSTALSWILKWKTWMASRF